MCDFVTAKGKKCTNRCVLKGLCLQHYFIVYNKFTLKDKKSFENRLNKRRSLKRKK